MTEIINNDCNSENDNSEGFRRRIRSFVRRQGRVTGSQQRAIDELWPRFGLEIKSGPIDIEGVFARNAIAPTILEIGFGNGHSLSQMAAVAPEKNYIGVEVHKPGVGSLLIEVRDKALTNIRIYKDDAVEVLEQCIVDASLDGVQLFFPDPWQKKRHHKRRIVQPQFIDILSKKLKPGGYFHMATDWENYAEHMMEVMAARTDFHNKAGVGQYCPKPDYRPNTKFEKRGERLGHGVWDLVFVKN